MHFPFCQVSRWWWGNYFIESQRCNVTWPEEEALASLCSGVCVADGNTSWRKKSVTWSAAGKAHTPHTHTSWHNNHRHPVTQLSIIKVTVTSLSLAMLWVAYHFLHFYANEDINCIFMKFKNYRYIFNLILLWNKREIEKSSGKTPK